MVVLFVMLAGGVLGVALMIIGVLFVAELVYRASVPRHTRRYHAAQRSIGTEYQWRAEALRDMLREPKTQSNQIVPRDVRGGARHPSRLGRS